MDAHVPGAMAETNASREANVGRASERAFFAIAALLFVGSAAVTIAWCASMSAMGGMTMPGGWTMSMTWMRMPGQTWPGVGAAFLGMWFVMMVAMMLPSLLPMLVRYRKDIHRMGETRVGLLTTVAGAGYFFAWTALGAVVFPLGAMLASLAMQWPALARAVPLATGIVVLLAGALQFSAWKLRYLACCRSGARQLLALPVSAGTAWRHGLRLGFHCICCCGGVMTLLLVIGVMNLIVMAAVTVAIAAERLAPGGAVVARVTGAVVVGAGLLMIATTDGLG